VKIIIPEGREDYNNVKVFLQGGNYWNNLSNGAALFDVPGGSFDPATGMLTVPGLGTGSYLLKALYETSGMEKTKYVILSNGDTKDVEFDLSGNSYAVSGTVKLSQTNPPLNIDSIQTLVATAPVNNTNSFPGDPFSTTTFRVIALDYAKVTDTSRQGDIMMSDLNPKHGVIHDDGSFSIPGLVPGVYLLVVPPLELDGNPMNGRETAGVEERVIVGAGDIKDRELTVAKGYSVKGQVKLPAGTNTAACALE
jgi:hypothetical protein